MTSVIDSRTAIRVSSTLNRDVKAYGKHFLTDGSDETCWNSDQGTPQYISMDFSPRSVSVSELHIMFQGGFAGKECKLVGVVDHRRPEEEQWEDLLNFYPEDSNSLQVFPIKEGASKQPWRKLRIIFLNSTDFYGRVTIYRLDVVGEGNG
ncbi:hypothetical protein SpCBS45565_g03009 [Spizellomyces sp. 'palustris']|nr:hypothetical protein SpCBS45565_g03009 [Spizellomyces sp. 'palustris']